ncbi:MAG: (2Fe-2S)-binding protein [Desulfobacter sp.]
MTVHIEFTLNNQLRAVDVPARMSALELVRDVLNLTGTKEGCGVGECGACTIEVDGRAVNACLMFAAQLDGCRVLTIEGLTGHHTDNQEADDALHPIQEAFAEHNGVQCGFCTPGFVMSTHALLKENPAPSDHEMTKAVAGNICRCTGYGQIFSSVRAACTDREGRPESTSDRKGGCHG